MKPKHPVRPADDVGSTPEKTAAVGRADWIRDNNGRFKQANKLQGVG